MQSSPAVLHVAQISFFSDPARRGANELLRAWPTLVDVARAAAQAGARVSVLQASRHWECLQRDAVSYHFLPFGSRDATRAGRDGLQRLLHDLKPDVLHVQGLGFARQVLRLTALTPHLPLLLQDHANRPPRFWRRPLWRRGLAAAGGVAFCAREQARPFVERKLLQPYTAIFEIPESTSRFSPGDAREARRACGLYGDPCVLWVGHLNDNKDPLAMLQGVSEAVRHKPGLRLWCCFGNAPLLSAVRARVAADPQLAGRVHLLGAVPHATVETLMRAADLYVSGSHREGSGYSLIEALACGLPPVVTDIPSFRVLTGGGAVGGLWTRGKPHSLVQALLRALDLPPAARRAAVRAHFERELSHAAVGRKLCAAYRTLVDRHGCR